MKIVLFCATQRGYLVLKKLVDIAKDCEIVVFSFKEEPWEPKFFDLIRDYCLEHNARFLEAKKVGAENLSSFWENNQIDLMLVVSWRYMIPARIYQRGRLGTFVFHDSLLPKYRGFSPTVWSIINGESSTGVTLFEIASEIDAGPIIAQKKVEISETDTIAMVMNRVTEAYLLLLETYFQKLLDNSAVRTPQIQNDATFTCKRLPEDNLIDWHDSCARIYNLIRAVTYPYPGAFTYVDGRLLRIWAAEKIPYPKYVGFVPGRIVEIRPNVGAVVIVPGGALLLTRVQFDGQDICTADKVLNNLSLTLG